MTAKFLREVGELVSTSNRVEPGRDPSNGKPRLRLYLEPERGAWPIEFLEVKIRGDLFYTWHVRAVDNERNLLDTHVVERTYRFVVWLNKQLERPGPWPRS